MEKYGRRREKSKEELTKKEREKKRV